MLPLTSAQFAVDAATRKDNRPYHENADYAHHLATLASARAAQVSWVQRLLPAGLRARIAARRHEKLLIATWENSPHLLADMGVILTRDADLPDHLSAAPQSLLDHVAARAPEQIVQAKMAFPATKAPPTTSVTTFDAVPARVRATKVTA